MQSLEKRIAALESAPTFHDVRDVPTAVLEAMLTEHFGHVPTDDELQALAAERVNHDRRD